MRSERIVFSGRSRPRPALFGLRSLLLAALAVTASCGGEGAMPPGTAPPPPPPPPPVAPVQVGTIPNQTVETGQTATLDVASYFRDPDGGALTYTAASSAAGVVSVSLSGSTLTMVGVADGAATVTVTARDPGGLTAVQSFGVTVVTPNRAPEAVGTIPNQTVATGRTATLAVSSYFRDPDGDALTYTVASSAPAVISVAISGSTLTMVGVADGTATVTVTAGDPDGLTAAQRFGVTVETPNRAPEAVGTIPNQTVDAGSTATLDVSGYFRDPDGDALTYTASSSASAVVSVSVSGSTLRLTGASAGTATVTVTARDPNGLTAAQGFRATVTASNRAPEAVGTIPNQTVATGGTATVDVTGYFRDPDGDALTYAAATSNALATASVSGSRVTVTGVAAGSATVTVTARDPSGSTAVQSFRATITASNRAPEAVGSIPGQNVSVGGTATVGVSSYFRDPDGDALTYTATSSASSVASVSVSGSSVTMRGVAAGTATVTVTVRDPGGLTATQRFGVTVQGGGGGAGFRDDFNSSASLGDWEVSNADAVVANGILRLTRTSSSSFGVAEHQLQAPLTDWTIRARVGDSDGQDELVGVWWLTGNSAIPALALTLGTIQSLNYTMWYFDSAGDGWTLFSDLSGHSTAVRTGVGEFTNVTVAFEAGTLVVSAGDTELINLPVSANNRFRPAFTNTQGILLVNEGSRGTTASYDWVEVTGDEGGGGGGGDACTVGLVLSPGESCTFSGGTFEVLGNGCVRVGSVSGICGRSIDINGLRATRMSGNRWEITGLPSGDADNGNGLTATSAVDLAETSGAKNVAVGMIIGTLEIGRKH